MKVRVVRAADRHEDWHAVALANDVSLYTARSWILKGRTTPLPKGGTFNAKVEEDHIGAIEYWLEDNPMITLTQIQEKLEKEFELKVCLSTVHNHVEGLLFTTKKIHYEPQSMNSAETKNRRRAFVQAILEYTGQGKDVIYIDETNVNLYTNRTYGRSKKGTRAIVQRPNSKGPNIHIIGAVAAIYSSL